jgi:spore coat polysaccharide biosynthesis protein SpsF
MPRRLSRGRRQGAILAVLQARMSSSRLPGKVLKPLLGRPMLARQIERVKRSVLIDRLLVATSAAAEDAAIEQLCAEMRVDCYRGSLDDVLDRFYRAAQACNPAYIVRLTGDCPLADPELIDAVIRFCVDGGYDYVSNALQPTFPDGLDTEVLRFSCLAEAWREARLPSEREHVTPFIYNNPGRFRIGSFTNQVDYSHLRWTVDEPEDFNLVEKIYTALYPGNPRFSSQEILALIERNPGIVTNAAIERNEGYARSLHKDASTPSSHG